MGITTKIMTMFNERHCKYCETETIYCQKINCILDSNITNGRKFEVLQSSPSLFFVRGGRAGEFIVDILKKTCSCLQFQQMQYPCVHAAATIAFCRLNIHDFVSNT